MQILLDLIYNLRWPFTVTLVALILAATIQSVWGKEKVNK